MPRPRTSAFVGVSLDGFLARSDDTLDFLTPFERTERGYTAFFASIDTLVIGRRTWDFVARMLKAKQPWPYPGKRVVVMTHRKLSAPEGVKAFSGTPAALMKRLTRERARHVYVDGGVVVRAFLHSGLLDSLTLTIVPVLIGEGRPLFGQVRLESGLRLEQVRPFPDGTVQLQYRVKPRRTR